ncbi:MAG: VOC family protein [Croceibacterium sp.]
MRHTVIALIGAAALVSAAGAAIARSNPLIGDEIGVDHVLLWSKDDKSAEAAFERLGFTLSEKAGSYGAGISNKLVWFKNWTFIEFLWLSEPSRTKAEAEKEYAFATTTNGSNGFGISVRNADETYRTLASAGLNPDQPGAEAYDPDGPEGPKAPVVNQWRFMFLKEGSLAGNPFFVEYKKKAEGQRPEQHANGAQRMSAIWILVEDARKAATAYTGAAFSVGRPIDYNKLGLKGVALEAGEGEIFLLQPTRNGAYRRDLQRRGEHVVGISVQVLDLGAVQKVLKQRMGKSPLRETGRFGPSLIPDVQAPLGLTFEFHR